MHTTSETVNLSPSFSLSHSLMLLFPVALLITQCIDMQVSSSWLAIAVAAAKVLHTFQRLSDLRFAENIACISALLHFDSFGHTCGQHSRDCKFQIPVLIFDFKSDRDTCRHVSCSTSSSWRWCNNIVSLNIYSKLQKGASSCVQQAATFSWQQRQLT